MNANEATKNSSPRSGGQEKTDNFSTEQEGSDSTTPSTASRPSERAVEGESLSERTSEGRRRAIGENSAFGTGGVGGEIPGTGSGA